MEERLVVVIVKDQGWKRLEKVNRLDSYDDDKTV